MIKIRQSRCNPTFIWLSRVATQLRVATSSSSRMRKQRFNVVLINCHQQPRHVSKGRYFVTNWSLKMKGLPQLVGLKQSKLVGVVSIPCSPFRYISTHLTVITVQRLVYRARDVSLIHYNPLFIELDDGEIYRKPLYLMVKPWFPVDFPLNQSIELWSPWFRHHAWPVRWSRQAAAAGCVPGWRATRVWHRACRCRCHPSPCSCSWQLKVKVRLWPQENEETKHQKIRKTRCIKKYHEILNEFKFMKHDLNGKIIGKNLKHSCHVLIQILYRIIEFLSWNVFRNHPGNRKNVLTAWKVSTQAVGTPHFGRTFPNNTDERDSLEGACWVMLDIWQGQVIDISIDSRLSNHAHTSHTSTNVFNDSLNVTFCKGFRSCL